MSTPHIQAQQNEIAKIVLMHGDPLRARYIANTYLENVVEFNHIRNMLGFTGYYNGIKVSVMGSGMGIPSLGIYSYELYKFYDVDTIIRLGSCVSYHESANILDVMLVSEAYSESSYARVQSGNEASKMYPCKETSEILIASSAKLNIPIIRGCIHSSDVLYREGQDKYYEDLYVQYGCLGVEMESFALFHNAEVLGKRAATLLTVSDSFVNEKNTTPNERETSFTNMMKIALEALPNVMKKNED